MMPSPYQGVGLGATGFGGSYIGGGYNYGGGMGGYGGGNSFGNSMTSMIGGVGHAVGGGMGIAGAIGGGMMGGIGGAVMGYGMGSMIGGGIKHVAGSFMTGAHEQSALERTLSQFQFQNGASRTGRGFSRTDSMQIGNMVREMERIPEMLTSFGELNRVMDKMGQMGLMQGIRDAGEFMRKFKETTTQLKDLAKLMGTSLEGALQAFGEARMSGFYSKGDITRNVLNRSVTSSLTGMNQGQIGALQQYGAEMGHAYGGSRRSGAVNMLRTANQLGAANQMGILTNDQIMEMTGKEGAEGIQDLAGQMGQLSYRMGNSNVGQALTLALGKQENGRYTGAMDQELVEKVRRGELSLGELKALARSKAGTRGAKLSFAAHKNRLRSEMAGAVGAEGIAMQLQEILGSRGWSNPDAQNLVMQRFGASEEQANLLQQLMPNLQTMGSQIGLAARNERHSAAVNATNREHGWDAIKHRIGKKIAHYTTDWAKDLGAGVRNYFQNWADDFLDDLTGQYRTEITKRVAETVSMGGAGLSGMRARVDALSKGLGANRFDVGSSGGFSGLAAKTVHWLSGAESKGERAADVLRRSGLGGSLTTVRGGDIFGQINSLMDLNSRNGMNNLTGNEFISSGDLQKSLNKVSELGGAGGQAALSELRSALGGDFDKLQAAYKSALASGELSGISDPKERLDKFTEMMETGGKGSGIMGRVRNSEGWELMERAKGALGGDMRVAAALQASMGGRGSRGYANFNQLASGSLGGFDSARSVATKLRDLDRSLSGTFKGGDSAGWADIKKYLDKGGFMSALITGANGKGGLGEDEDLALLLETDPAKWQPADKEKLKGLLGADGLAKLTSKLNSPEGAEEISRLTQSLRKNKGSLGDLKEYVAFSEASGLWAADSQYRSRGESARERLSSDSTKEARTRLAGSTKGLQLLGMVSTNASQFSTFGAGASDNTADIVASLRGVDKNTRSDVLRVGSDELRHVYAYDQETREKLRGKGLTTQGILDKVVGAGAEVPKELRDAIESAVGGGKKGVMDGKEIDQVMKVLDTYQSRGLTGKAGVEQKNANVSEQEIANTIKTMSENAKITSEILRDLAGGKPVGSGTTKGSPS